MSTSLEQLLYAFLLGDSAVVAALGNDSASPTPNPSLYLVQLPPGVVDGYYPACTYQRISTNRLYVHSVAGVVNGSAGWARFQFTVWAKGNTSGNQTDIATRAILNRLASFNGQSNGVGAANFCLSQSMHVEADVDPPLFKSIFDVRVFYQDQ